MARSRHRINAFDLEPGRRIGGKYVVGHLIGYGWEGEVYHVRECATGIERAAKLFFPERNVQNRAVKFYAKKLDKLSGCPIVIQYCTQDTFQFRRQKITFLVSEYAPGLLLPEFIAQRKGKRLHPFEAVHLLHTLVTGLEQIHGLGEYHGDLHAENIIVRQVGLGFQLKLVDLYNWGRRTAEHVRYDIQSAIRVFHQALGGAKHYRNQPPEVKAICCGLKNTLIDKKFRTARHLKEHLEKIEWV